MLPFPFFKGGLPKWFTQNYVNNDIQKFVNEVMEQSISSSLKNAKMMGSMYMNPEDERETEKQEEPEKRESAKESLHAMTFESLDHVYVKVLLTDSSLLSDIKIYHNSNQLILEGIPAREDRQVITLPSAVTMKDTVSEYRDSFLQIKMKKRNDPQFTEIAVPPLE